MAAHCLSVVPVSRRAPAPARRRRCAAQRSQAATGGEACHLHKHELCWYARPENALATRLPSTPFFILGRPLPRACRTTVGFNVAAVQRGTVPVDIALSVGMSLEGVQDASPCAVTLPAREPVPASLPGSISFRNITPGSACFQTPENAVDDPAMTNVAMTAPGIRR